MYASVSTVPTSLAETESRAVVVKDVEKQLVLTQSLIGIATLDDFIKDVRDGYPIYSKLSEWEKINLLYNFILQNLKSSDTKK